MEKLLQWSIANSSSEALKEAKESNQEPRKFDPELMRAIFGKSDVERIREAMDAIESPDVSIDNKIIAFDNIEQMVEKIDTANDLEPLKMWPRILKCFDHEEPEIRLHAAWVCGTSMQNNPKAQKAFLQAGGLDPLLKALKEDDDVSVKTKALYTLNAFLKHNPEGMELFFNRGGFAVLRDHLGSNAKVSLKRKTLFTLVVLLLGEDQEVAAQMIKNGLVEAIVPLTIDEDQDVMEKSLQVTVGLARSSASNISLLRSLGLPSHITPLKDRLAASWQEPSFQELRDHISELEDYFAGKEVRRVNVDGPKQPESTQS